MSVDEVPVSTRKGEMSVIKCHSTRQVSTCLECVRGWGKERFCETPSGMMGRIRVSSAVRVSMALTHLTLLLLRTRDVLDTFER
jgi:hypothetical protein